MTEDHLPRISPVEALREGAGTLIDVRRHAARVADPRELRGAPWCDPETLSPADLAALPDGRLLFFCVHGHQVSQFAAAFARFHGRDAAYVAGGIEGLAAAGASMGAAQ
ncbi:MAG: sulfurtransferase [Pseudomonadota bacterium]